MLSASPGGKRTAHAQRPLRPVSLPLVRRRVEGGPAPSGTADWARVLVPEMIDDLEAAVAARLLRAIALRPPRVGLGSSGLLGVRLLGPVSIAWQGAPVRLTGAMPHALAALMVLRPGLRSREQIATELWPDGGPASSAWLRQTLWQLRKGMGDAADRVLEVDGERIGIRADVDVDLDVAAFEAALQARPPRLADAIQAYGGDLLEGSNLECFARERERLSDLYEDTLAVDGAQRFLRGDLDGARTVALRLVERDPLREEAHALLIQVYGMAGSRSQVSRQYRRLRRILAGELGVEPLQETELAYRAALEEAAARSRARAASLGIDPPAARR